MGLAFVPVYIAYLGMEAYGRATAEDDWQQVTAPSAAARDAANAFLEQHRWLRRLASSGALEAALGADHPGWTEIRLVVSYPVLDRATGRVRLTTDERVVVLTPAGDPRA